MHLLGNMLGLYFFGSAVGRAFGGRALLGLYLAGGLAGSLAHVAWKWNQIRGTASEEKAVCVATATGSFYKACPSSSMCTLSGRGCCTKARSLRSMLLQHPDPDPDVDPKLIDPGVRIHSNSQILRAAELPPYLRDAAIMRDPGALGASGAVNAIMIVNVLLYPTQARQPALLPAPVKRIQALSGWYCSRSWRQATPVATDFLRMRRGRYTAHECYLCGCRCGDYTDTCPRAGLPPNNLTLELTQTLSRCCRPCCCTASSRCRWRCWARCGSGPTSPAPSGCAAFMR